MAHQPKGKRGKSPSRWHERKRSKMHGLIKARPIRAHAKHLRGDNAKPGKRAALAVASGTELLKRPTGGWV